MKPKKALAKHGRHAMPDKTIQRVLTEKIKHKDVPCAVAFVIAQELKVLPSEVGRTVDLMGLKLVKCQLGLFGYSPRKSIVTPLSSVPQDLEQAIKAQRKNQGLPCEAAWKIAEKLGIRKMRVSAACDALEIKIKPCQLGAF